MKNYKAPFFLLFLVLDISCRKNAQEDSLSSRQQEDTLFWRDMDGPEKKRSRAHGILISFRTSHISTNNKSPLLLDIRRRRLTRVNHSGLPTDD
jgi:hypothetical protein